MARREVLIFCLFSLFAAVIFPREGYGNSPANGKASSFADFIEKVEKQTGYSIAYPSGDIELKKAVPEDISGLSARQAILEVLDPNVYKLVVAGKHIIIKKNPRVPEIVQEQYNVAPPAPGQIIDKIPPPQQSVYSGETRLIIIRRDTIAAQQQSVHNTSVFTGRHPISRTDGRQTAITEIPFRTDLLEREVYRKEPVSDKRKKKKSKEQKN